PQLLPKGNSVPTGPTLGTVGLPPPLSTPTYPPLFDREEEAKRLLENASVKKVDIVDIVDTNHITLGPKPEDEFEPLTPIDICFAQAHSEQWVIPVFINGMLLKGIADTGASHTI